MEYATGVVTKTSDFTSVASVLVNGKPRLFPFGRAIFYSYGLKCDGRMSNILEEGMEVGVCYKMSPLGEPCILAVWFGDPPETVGDACVPCDLYDQRGSVSYFVDDENFLVQNDGGHYTVMISTNVVHCDGRRMKDVGVAVSVEDVVMYDASPFDTEHPSGASYRATCAWLGPEAPRLVDRFHLQSMEKHTELFEHDVHGVVVTIPNDAIAVVEVIAESDALKVLVFRNSFRIDCVSIRDEVVVGDILLMRLGHFVLSTCKQLVATEALKLNQDMEGNDVRTESQNCVTGDEIELSYVLPRTDHELPIKTERGVMGEVDNVADSVLPKVDAGVPDFAPNWVKSVLNPGNGKNRNGAMVEKGRVTYRVPENENFAPQNGVSEGHDLRWNDISVPSKADKIGSAVQGLTKHFNHVRSGTISGRSLLSDRKGDAKKTATEKTVRNYVGVGVKSVESTDGVKEIIEVANVISTYSDVLQVGKARETSEPEPDHPLPKLTEDRNNNTPACVTDLTASESLVRSCNSVNRASKPSLDVNSVTTILPESHLDRKPVGDSILCVYPPILCTYNPPLKGVFSSYSLDCGMISFGNFKVFVKPDNFYIDGVPCPLKHFIKFAKPGKSTVCFEAVAQSAVTEMTEFSHEATCAWVGRKPSLIDVSLNLPPPKLSLLQLRDQYFCGIVSKLYLPNFALIVIQGDPTTVIAHVRSFTKPLYSGSVGYLISDYANLYDTLMFKVKEVDSKSNLLVACDVRNRKK